MKKITLFVIACLLLGAVMAQANPENGFTITPKLAANITLNKDSNSFIGNQYGILLEGEFNSLIQDSKSTLGLEIGYLGSKGADHVLYGSSDWDYEYAPGYTCWRDSMAQGVNFKTYSVPIMVTYKYTFDPDNKFYVKAGLGVAFNQLKSSGDLFNSYTWADDEEIHHATTIESGRLNGSKSKTNFAFELGVGCKFANNIVAELLYANYGKFDIDGFSVSGKDNFKSSNLQASLGYAF